MINTMRWLLILCVFVSFSNCQASRNGLSSMRHFLRDPLSSESEPTPSVEYSKTSREFITLQKLDVPSFPDSKTYLKTHGKKVNWRPYKASEKKFEYDSSSEIPVLHYKDVLAFKGGKKMPPIVFVTIKGGEEKSKHDLIPHPNEHDIFHHPNQHDRHQHTLKPPMHPGGLPGSNEEFFHRRFFPPNQGPPPFYEFHHPGRFPRLSSRAHHRENGVMKVLKDLCFWCKGRRSSAGKPIPPPNTNFPSNGPNFGPPQLPHAPPPPGPNDFHPNQPVHFVEEGSEVSVKDYRWPHPEHFFADDVQEFFASRGGRPSAPIIYPNTR